MCSSTASKPTGTSTTKKVHAIENVDNFFIGYTSKTIEVNFQNVYELKYIQGCVMRQYPVPAS